MGYVRKEADEEEEEERLDSNMYDTFVSENETNSKV